MNYKIDTKEKFTSITIEENDLNVNVAASLTELCMPILSQLIKNIILVLENVDTIEEKAAEALVKLQQLFYENNASFVVCCFKKNVEDSLEKMEILELLNYTPTLSEAWDIVQMEEIERELLDSDDVEFDLK
jgi:anti-anti-sigma factor